MKRFLIHVSTYWCGMDDIITEIADVMIMCEQLSNYFGKEKVELEKERKLERLKERLSKYTD